MRFVSICSSSSGNCTYIGTNEAGILVDVGVSSMTMLKRGLDGAGISQDCVKALFITHEHTDHIHSLYGFTKTTRVPVYMTAGTMRAVERRSIGRASRKDNIGMAYRADFLHLLDEYNASDIGFDIDVTYFPTPHDAEQSVGFRFELDGHSIGYCTDLGYVTKEVFAALKTCEFAFIEANYSEDMLKNGTYPPYLKKRISGPSGHLSNAQCGELAVNLVKSGVTRLCLGHVSERNNTPFKALEHVRGCLADEGIRTPSDCIVSVAPAVSGGGFINL